jgi:hypothetical protein
MAAQRDTDALERAARASWRVFTVQQLPDFGFGRHRIQSMVARGQLHAVHRGIDSYAHPDVPGPGSSLAAQDLAGEGAYLTRGSGLAVMGLRKRFLREIGVTATTARRSRDGVIVHRTKLAPEPDEVRTDGPLCRGC